MAAMRLTEQIQRLVDSDDIDTKSAVVLLLSAHAELIEKQDEIMDRLDKISDALSSHTQSVDEDLNTLRKRVEALEKYNVEHPPLLWLARYRTKQTIAVVIFIILLLLFVLTSSLREPLLEFFNLPVF